MFTSIKYRLVIWFLSIVSIVFSGLGSFLYYELKSIVIGSVDSHLNLEVTLISGLLEVEKGHGHLEIELVKFSESVRGEYAVPLSGHYFQITLSDGRVVARSPSLSIVDAFLPATEVSFEPYYKNIVGPDKTPHRILGQSFRFFSETITIQVSDSLEDAYKLLRSVRGVLLVVLPGIFLLSMFGIWIITDMSLKSLNIFSRKVRLITEKNLNERIEESGMDRELQPLAKGFNTMLGRLEDAFLRQREFLSDASHELRTPTSVIKSYCDVILRRERTQAEYQDAIRKITETVNWMSVTINKILEVSRLESKTFSFKLSDVDLIEIMKDVVKLLKPSASDRGIVINLSGRKTTIRGDRERLMEAFTNIVDNGIKYNMSGGRVDIDVRGKKGWAVVSVADTGIGMLKSEKERIFDRFYRLDTSRNRVAGCGLGLSIVKSIVEAHRGRIEVESEVGKGSCFLVFLPQACDP